MTTPVDVDMRSPDTAPTRVVNTIRARLAAVIHRHAICNQLAPHDFMTHREPQSPAALLGAAISGRSGRTGWIGRPCSTTAGGDCRPPTWEPTDLFVMDAPAGVG